MTKICINGNFFCRSLTGIERFAYEITKRFDALVPKGVVEIYVPKNIPEIPVFENIKVIVSHKNVNSFMLWEQIVWASYLRKNEYMGLSFGNVMPIFAPGIVFIHDIYPKLYPKDFSGYKQKLRRAYMCMMFHYAVYHAKKLITVSEFSKKQISDAYKIDAEKISVIPNGWEHFRDIEADENIFEKCPALKTWRDTSGFYFTLGSMQKRKNLAWIVEYARLHPNDFFAISGQAISGFGASGSDELSSLPNVLMLGRVSDGEVKALMQSCKAFIFPSYFEGFGIPPLEALSCGAKIVVARAASLPEIYGDAAHYIDPFNTDVDLDKLLAEPVASPDKVLEKYSYDRAAQLLFAVLFDYLKEIN